jgi:septum formation protein
MRIVLASRSPRRAEILRHAGFSYEVRPVDSDETLLPEEGAFDYVRRLAQAKARRAADLDSVEDNEPSFVIGADTAVVAQGQVLGKPVDDSDARRMLALLSGKTHEVLTGVTVLGTPGREHATEAVLTRVMFLPLSKDDIDSYIATGEPFGKAGAYGIQGIGGRFIGRIEGCYFNVVGMPISKLWQMLCALGWRAEKQ